MFALVFWTGAKKTSVVKVKDLCPEKAEGETTSVRYELHKRNYKAKIIRKSGKSCEVI